MGVEANEDSKRDDEDDKKHGGVIGLDHEGGPACVAGRALGGCGRARRELEHEGAGEGGQEGGQPGRADQDGGGGVLGGERARHHRVSVLT